MRNQIRKNRGDGKNAEHIPNERAAVDVVVSEFGNQKRSRAENFSACAIKYKRLQLSGYFSSVIGGDEVEKVKPDPQGLLKACEQLGMGHDDLIYVGDSDADIMAAKAIAAYSIAYVSDTAREPGLRALRPCSLIYDFRELGSIVKEEREWSDTTIL